MTQHTTTSAARDTGQKKLGTKGLKALARRYSYSDWQTICGDVRGWGLAEMTAAEADVACHRILNGTKN